MRHRLLSYPLGTDTPVYGNNPPLAVELDREIRRGDSCNTAVVTFHNHTGTHMDAPRHFFDSGLPVSEFRIEELVFDGPVVVDCPKGPSELVQVEDLEGCVRDLEDCDLLLVRTGFHRNRGEAVYMTDNPGISPEAASWLRRKFRRLRGIGIDSLSVGAFRHRELGRQTHRTLLAEGKPLGRSRIIVEDMDLSGTLARLSRVYVVPIFIQGVDSTPCTVIAEFAR